MILFVGRLDPIKGLDTLLERCRSSSPARARPGGHLSVRHRWADARSDLEQMTAEHGASQQVPSWGWATWSTSWAR